MSHAYDYAVNLLYPRTHTGDLLGKVLLFEQLKTDTTQKKTPRDRDRGRDRAMEGAPLLWPGWRTNDFFKTFCDI